MTRTSRRLLKLAASLVAVISATGIGLGGYGWHVLHASRPILSRQIEIVGLSGPVVITRDAQGAPRIVASSRPDLARALGFLHGQERFFEMDLMRHAGAGALSELVGQGAVSLDQRLRLHRFAQRARHLLSLQSPDDRALLDAYSAGVNAGLHALGHLPFEYSILRVRPRDWQPADSLLVVYAMYLDLQPSTPRAQQDRAMLRQALGPDMAAFLMPRATPLDAPIDGSVLPAPPMPETMALPLGHSQQAPLPVPEHGSNSFAVSGHLTATGSAMLANDMHLALSVPNIWYRAELVQTGAHPRHLIGVTLPGEPFVISGSNGAVTWALTDGYIETGDAIRLDPVPGASNAYQTPDGPRPITTSHEHLVVAHGASHDVPVEETIWGPVMGRDASGARLVWRWSAHDDNAIRYDGFRGLEDARSVQEGLDAAHHAGLPQQNILLADAQGHIAWSIIGPVPDRYGLDDGLPHSWASGDHGWHGYLTPDEVPQIIDPPGGRLWTANGRVVGGDALRLLGDGGYADGLRASRIRDDLYARNRFAESDMLAIETDDHADALRTWQALLLHATTVANIPDLRSETRNWGERAVPDSIGYRLVHDYRAHALQIVFGAYTSLPITPRSAWSVETLLTRRPSGLVPPGFDSWDDVDRAIIARIQADVAKAGTLSQFTWGRANHVGIHHPLSRFIPGLHVLTDPPDVAEAGDTMLPRVAVPGFGASERQVISPGHEEQALFDMPMGEASDPLAPYYGAGQADWVAGRAEPLLPGPARWTLVLTP